MAAGQDKDILAMYGTDDIRPHDPSQFDGLIAPSAHAIGGASHTASTLASLSGKVSDGTLANKITMIDGPLSPQILTGGVLSDGTNAGTVKVSALTALIRATDAATGVLQYITLAEQDNKTLAAANTTYHVILTLAGPAISVQAASANGTTEIGIGTVMKDAANNMHWNNLGMRLQNGVAKLHTRAATLRSTELCCGCAIGDLTNLNFSIASGRVYHGINPLTPFVAGAYSSLTDKFVAIYGDTANGFTYSAIPAAETDIDNLQYYDGAGALATALTNQYLCHYVYLHPDDEHVYVMYGTTHGKLAEAEQAQPSSDLPIELSDFSVLLGKIIIKKSATSFTTIQMVTTYRFSGTAVADHNALANLQGGTADQYYHLTSAQHTQTIILDNLDAAVAPTVNDDVDLGYSVGSRWVNTTADKAYICVDATAGAAVWIDVSGGLHALGGAVHNADTLAHLNTKVSDATLVSIPHVSQAHQPTPLEGAYVMWHDTDDAAVRLLFNDPVADVVSVELSPALPLWSFEVTTAGAAVDFIMQTDTAVNLIVNWGDGNEDTYNGTGLRTHQYASAGVYRVRIVAGTATRIAFGAAGCTPTLVTEVLSAVDVALGLTSAVSMFSGCTNLAVFAANWFDAASANITHISEMFRGAVLANPDVSLWDTSSISQMAGAFRLATSANPDVTLWSTGSLDNASYMFRDAVAFNRDISAWDVTAFGNGTGMLQNSAFSQANYDKLLSLTTGWPSQVLHDSVVFHAGSAKYDDETPDIANGRAHLVDALPADHAWTITDGGPD